MVVFLGVSLTLSLFGSGFLFFALENSKSQLSLLRKLNTDLNQEVTEYKAKNSQLWVELNKEKDLIEPGTKISWQDKQGDTNLGVVLDDYLLNDKPYVVVIRMKDDKTQGAPISIPFEKITIV
jgi:hypothetical protein